MNRKRNVPGFVLLPGILAVVFCFCLAGCESEQRRVDTSQQSGDKRSFQITAVSYPLQFLTRAIVGDLVVVTCPLPADSDPETWRPGAAQIAAMQSSDLIVVNGSAAPYAKWLKLVTLPESKICKTANEALNLSDFIVAEGKQLVHSHGPEGEHSHPVMVSRTWLDPKLAREQAKYIWTQAAKLYPEHKSTFEANFRNLEGSLDALVQRLETMKESNQARQRSVVTLDSRLKFLTQAAGLQESTFVNDGSPDAEKFKAFLDDLLARPKHSPPAAIVWSQPPAQELLDVARQAGLPSATVKLLDQAPENGDYVDELTDSISLVVSLTEARVP